MIDKLQKLYNLAQRGVGGEKDNAEALLQKLLNKYNLTLADITEDSKSIRTVKYYSIQEQSLIAQLLWKLFDIQRIEYIPKEKTIVMELTDVQWIELSEHLKFYIPLFREERKALMQQVLHAFFIKHNIFGENAASNSNEISMEDYSKLLDLASSMQDKTYRKTLKSADE